MTDETSRAGDGGPRAGAAIDPAAAEGVTDPQPRKLRHPRRKRRRGRKDQIDIAKVLLAPVRLLQGARARQISAFEATLRAQVTKAIEGKDSASIKALIDFAIQYDLVAPPAKAARSCGVFVVPKGLSGADQREIFDPDTTSMSRIIEIILRHYDAQSR